MAKAVWNMSYKLKKHVTDEEFIAATKTLHDELVSKATGFISWEQFKQGEVWTDFVTFETLEDANNALTIGEGSEIADTFYALIRLQTCRTLVSEFVMKYS